MPFLKREPCLYPLDLFAPCVIEPFVQRNWWCLTTTARAEKAVSRALFAQQVPFYCPLVLKRFRSPNGRLRESYIPLFPSYIFVGGDDGDRAAALKTNKISRCQSVVDRVQLLGDLSRIQIAIEAGIPMTPEARMQAGDPVRVRSGPFAGVEGHVLRREGKTRLLLSVRYIEQGVSMEIDEALLERV
jgi:transcriptional antiterminator RfaH